MNKYYYIIGAVIVVFIAIALQQNSQPRACTEEVKLCPDGSAVGRVAPDCDFAPCPGDACCHSFGYGSEMVRCCDEYQWTSPEECTVPQGFVGGGKEIVNDSFCKSCTCPEGYIPEGDSCNPKCYYSTPKCLAPSIVCGTTNK